jgi:hypothetical protein
MSIDSLIDAWFVLGTTFFVLISIPEYHFFTAAILTYILLIACWMNSLWSKIHKPIVIGLVLAAVDMYCVSNEIWRYKHPSRYFMHLIPAWLPCMWANISLYFYLLYKQPVKPTTMKKEEPPLPIPDTSTHTTSNKNQ